MLDSVAFGVHRVLAAAGDATPSDPITYLIGLGLPGIFIAGFMFDWIYPRSAVTRRDKIIDDQAALIKQMYETAAGEFVPALTVANGLLERIPDSEAKMAARLDEIRSAQRALDDTLASLERRQR